MAFLGREVVEGARHEAGVVLQDPLAVALHRLEPLPAPLDGRKFVLGRRAGLRELRQLGPQLVPFHEAF